VSGGEPGDPGAGEDGLGAQPVAAVTPRPQIFSRAQWGADEGLRRSSPSYFEVRAGFVHHTVNTNTYTRNDVPALMRSIYAYHTRSRGWSDIGYNFIVDKFGRVWEGRFGGVDRPVVGAHTSGYNDYAFAGSALGNFETVQPPAAMITAFANLFAWKLSLHGVDAAATAQRVGSRTFPAINGHRDAGSTACPGKFLYARLGDIRARAKAAQGPWTARDRRTTLTSSPRPDFVVRNATTKQLFTVATGGTLAFVGKKKLADGFGSGWAWVSPVGDLNGDGRADLMARRTGSKQADLYVGNGSGFTRSTTIRPAKFATMDMVVAAGRFNGDRHADVIARQADTGKLFLLRGKGNGTFRKRLLMGEGFGAYDTLVGLGDVNGDGHADLGARDRSGALWLFPGTGTKVLGARTRMPGAWQTFDAITAGGDLTGDGIPDLVARDRASQQTYVYPGNGRAGFQSRQGPFTAQKGLSALAVAGQVRGSAHPDLVGIQNGSLWVVAHRGTVNVRRMASAGTTVTGSILLNVGDWNNDGRADLITGPGNGKLYLRPGRGDGTFGPGILMSSGFSGISLLAAVGDMTGDGLPDLVGRPPSGGFRVYPSNGATGFGVSYVVRSRFDAAQQVGLGLWDGDGAPDSGFRVGNSLVLYPGNGPGGLMAPRTIATGLGAYDWLVSVGDVNGDGRNDLIARDKASGRLFLLPGTASGGLGAARPFADGFAGYDLVG